MGSGCAVRLSVTLSLTVVTFSGRSRAKPGGGTGPAAAGGPGWLGLAAGLLSGLLGRLPCGLFLNDLLPFLVPCSHIDTSRRKTSPGPTRFVVLQVQANQVTDCCCKPREGPWGV